MIKRMDKASCTSTTVIFTKENGGKDRKTVKECINSQIMEMFMKGVFKQTKKKAKEYINGLITLK